MNESRKIQNKDILDSEIILDIRFECAKKDSKFDINWCDLFNRSLLMIAILQNREELVRYLLTYPQLNINYKNPHGITAFHILFHDLSISISILKSFLSRKDFDVNIQGYEGWTGLHIACFWGREAFVKELLLDARVDVMIRNNRGDMALDITFGHYKVAKMLKRIGLTSLLRIPNRTLLYDIVRMIIEEYV